MKTKSFRRIFGTFAVLAFTIGAGIAIRSASAGTETGSGWLWGGGVTTNPVGYDGAGWASMNDTNSGSGGGTYGVNIPASGDLSGYAWNEHYGWISFNGADLAGCAPALSQATRTGNNIAGGARILSIRDAGANAGGFDGCISLSGTATNGSPYGVAVSGTTLGGYAWSSDLGWIDMSGASVGGATCGGQVTDSRDGTIYDTVLIGTQCWMRENMNIGTRIPSSTAQSKNTPVEIIEKYCYNNQDTNCTTNHPTYPDGGLYTWDEAMQYSTTEGAQGICPAGWHIPTDAEWYALENYLKDTGQTCDANRSGSWDCSSAGIKMKSGGISGFEGNMAGFYQSGFFMRDIYTPFWSSSESGTDAVGRTLDGVVAKVFRALYGKTSNPWSMPVRCIQGTVTPSTLEICIDDGGTLVPLASGNNGTFTLQQMEIGNTKTLRAFYDNDGNSCAGSDITSSAVWNDALNNPNNAVNVVSGTVTAIANGTESFTASSNGQTITGTVTVAPIVPPCSTCNDEKTQHCPTEAWTSGCGASCASGTGTRTCDMNWKEVTPGL